MGWGAQQWLRVCKEATYGVVLPALDAGTAVEGTDYWWIRLGQGNAFTPRRVPVPWSIRSAEGGNRVVQTGSSFYTIGGSLSTFFYPSRAQLWLAALLTLTANDLASYTFDYFDTVRTRRLLGMKAAAGTLSCESQSQITGLQVDLVGQQQDLAAPATFAAPALTNFPSEAPYVHQDTAGLVLINNVVRTKYSSLKVMIKNKLAATKDELPYLSGLFHAGRDVAWELKCQDTAATDRAAMEGVSVRITNQVKWNNGTNTATLDLKSSNYIRTVADDLPLDDAAYQTLGIDSIVDRAATTDVSFATT
jgi:hypothetical protein